MAKKNFFCMIVNDFGSKATLNTTFTELFSSIIGRDVCVDKKFVRD